MKVNEIGMLMNLLVICAVSSFVLLSATAIPVSDEKSSQEIVSTSTVSATANITDSPIESTTQKQTSEQSENASVEGAQPDTKPPLVFPTEEEKSQAKNETALKILQSVSNKSSEDVKQNETTLEVTTLQPALDNSSSTEALKPTEASKPTEETVTNTSSAPKNSTEEPEEDYDSISEETGKTDAENIQDNAEQQQEDDLEEQFSKTGSDKTSINLFQDPVTNEPALHSGHFALIFASTLIILSVVAYIGLILWRSRLESRYGMRQRLVTEDVFYSDSNNQNDVRYFGL